MTTIVTRAGKGSPLTNNEVDSNFTNLNDAKIETLTSTDTSVTITGTGSSRDLSVPVNPNVVSGPASSTDNAVARFDTTTGKLIQNSVVTIDDAGVVAGASISGASNTLSNIGNSALTNSAITINGNATALGGSVSVGTVTSVGITPSTGVTVSGSPITTSGNITVGLSTKLTDIENLSGAGFITQNGSGAIAGRTIQAGTGISVAHGNGSSQDPVITNTAPDQTVALTAGTGISTSGTYPNFTITNTAPSSGGTVTSVATGTGLSGGPITSTGTISLANTAVTPGSYTATNLTVDAQGRITAASNGSAGATISDDTTTNATRYPLYAAATSGTASTVYTSSTKYTYNPSTGVLSSTVHTSTSDERLKTNWRPVAANFVSQLANVKSGIFDRTDFSTTDVGVGAQSLQPLLPQAVITGEDGYLSVNYGGAALVAAIELAKVVEELRAEIAVLKAKVGE